jgi:hypothetical protein
MNRCRTLTLLVLAAITAGSVSSVFAGRSKVAENRAMVRLLDEACEMKDFQQVMSLKEAAGLLMEKFAAKGKELPISIDAATFRKEYPDLDIYGQHIQFQPFPKLLSLEGILKGFVSQIADADATFLIREGTVVITTAKEASLERLLQRKVIAEFNNTPLADALDELSAGTGASIVLDIRLGDKLRSPVTASLKNDVSLESALRMLTDMVDLKVVLLPAGIYVTHPFHADNMEKELAERRKHGKNTSSKTQPANKSSKQNKK